MSLVTLRHVGMRDLPGPRIELASPALAGTSKASACNAGGMGSISGLEDPLEEERRTHSSILAWEIPWTEKPGGLQSMESQTVGHDWAHVHNNYRWATREAPRLVILILKILDFFSYFLLVSFLFYLTIFEFNRFGHFFGLNFFSSSNVYTLLLISFWLPLKFYHAYLTQKKFLIFILNKIWSCLFSLSVQDIFFIPKSSSFIKICLREFLLIYAIWDKLSLLGLWVCFLMSSER